MFGNSYTRRCVDGADVKKLAYHSLTYAYSSLHLLISIIHSSYMYMSDGFRDIVLTNLD